MPLNRIVAKGAISVTSPDFVVVQAHPDLISYVDHLQRKNAEALSFYPRVVFEREYEAGRLFLGLLNGQPCGYLYVGARGPDVKCHQVCIQYDARRKLYGAALVTVMEDYAAGCYTLTLRCGADLEANRFWREMGYECVAIHDGGVRRMRRINVWRKTFQDLLFAQDVHEPEASQTNSSLWRKHKQTGLVTQFVRGRSMREYRARILSEK